MFRHHQNEHGGGEEPKFMARVVQYHKSTLSRQLGEAVRIRRRGGQGSILNSKSEFDRCWIPRLTIDENEEGQAKVAIEKEQEELNKVMELLNVEESTWGDSKNKEMSRADKMSSSRMSLLVRNNATKMEQGTVPREKKGARN